MIKITHSGVPTFYQVDSSYRLPQVTGAVQWNGAHKCFEVSTGNGWMAIDPSIDITHSSELQEIVAWAKKKMQEEQLLEKLRSKYPSLDEAYKHYEFIREMVKEH